MTPKRVRLSSGECCLGVGRRKLTSGSFDVGGTSTDVSRYAGKYELTYETTTAGISVQSPQLDINTVSLPDSASAAKLTKPGCRRWWFLLDIPQWHVPRRT